MVRLQNFNLAEVLQNRAIPTHSLQPSSIIQNLSSSQYSQGGNVLPAIPPPYSLVSEIGSGGVDAPLTPPSWFSSTAQTISNRASQISDYISLFTPSAMYEKSIKNSLLEPYQDSFRNLTNLLNIKSIEDDANNTIVNTPLSSADASVLSPISTSAPTSLPLSNGTIVLYMLGGLGIIGFLVGLSFLIYYMFFHPKNGENLSLTPTEPSQSKIVRFDPFAAAVKSCSVMDELFSETEEGFGYEWNLTACNNGNLNNNNKLISRRLATVNRSRSATPYDIVCPDSAPSSPCKPEQGNHLKQNSINLIDFSVNPSTQDRQQIQATLTRGSSPLNKAEDRRISIRSSCADELSLLVSTRSQNVNVLMRTTTIEPYLIVPALEQFEFLMPVHKTNPPYYLYGLQWKPIFAIVNNDQRDISGDINTVSDVSVSLAYCSTDEDATSVLGLIAHLTHIPKTITNNKNQNNNDKDCEMVKFKVERAETKVDSRRSHKSEVVQHFSLDTQDLPKNYGEVHVSRSVDDFGTICVKAVLFQHGELRSNRTSPKRVKWNDFNNEDDDDRETCNDEYELTPVLICAEYVEGAPITDVYHLHNSEGSLNTSHSRMTEGRNTLTIWCGETKAAVVSDIDRTQTRTNTSVVNNNVVNSVISNTNNTQATLFSSTNLTGTAYAMTDEEEGNDDPQELINTPHEPPQHKLKHRRVVVQSGVDVSAVILLLTAMDLAATHALF